MSSISNNVLFVRAEAEHAECHSKQTTPLIKIMLSIEIYVYDIETFTSHQTLCNLTSNILESHPGMFYSLSVIPKVTKHLLSNPVFTCIGLAACMEIAVVAGFAAFLGKYLEQQFNLTTSSANQLLGKRKTKKTQITLLQ